MSDEKLPTKERLARAIEARRGDKYDPRVERMITLAREGHYDDYESPLDMPTHALVAALRQVGFDDLAQCAINGDFDGTREEAQAWMNNEGWKLLLHQEGNPTDGPV